MSPTSFASLPPEIIGLITPLLNQHDLSQCVRVCHTWRSLFTPFLWRDLRVMDTAAYYRLNTAETTAAFIRNKHHIRSLQTTAPGLVRFLAIQSPAITGLQSLCLLGNEASPFEATPLPLVHPPEGVDAVNIDTPDALVALLLHNKNLRSLTIGDNFLHPHNSMDVFFQAMSSFPASCLEALDISSTYTTTDSYFERELGKLRDLNRMHDTMVQLHRAHQPFMALKELAISGRKGNRINYSRLAFIGRCTQVERIRLFQLDDWVILALSKAFQMFCPRLTQLEWTGCIENGGEEIARVLRSSQSGWKTIKLDVMNDFDDLASEALMESVRTTLEEIKVNCWGQMSEVNHLDILCSGSRLRRFEGAGHGERIGNSLQATIHAYDAFMEHSQGVKDRTWALGPSIEYLQLRIVGVPRPDVVCRQSGKPFLEPLVELDDCNRYDVQRYIYEQLGRMSNLHDLVLGTMDFARPSDDQTEYAPARFQYDCLEFSLESGLELLVGLKELRILDVKNTAHRIGVEELDWMRTNWPKLKTIVGLDWKRGWAGDAEDGLAVKAEVDAWMVAHPNGIGSSFYA